MTINLRIRITQSVKMLSKPLICKLDVARLRSNLEAHCDHFSRPKRINSVFINPNRFHILLQDKVIILTKIGSLLKGKVILV